MQGLRQGVQSGKTENCEGPARLRVREQERTGGGLFCEVREMSIGPVLRYPGSKWKLARWIIEHMPPHTIYLESFFGSGAVFFNKKPSKVEAINDIDGNVVNLFRMIRERPEELARRIEFTPWARDEYNKSCTMTGDPLEDARLFVIRLWQGKGSVTDQLAGWDRRIQCKTGGLNIKLWQAVPKRILDTAKRLKTVYIENRSALDLIPHFKREEVLIYADPPYLNETRSGGKMYAHEMTNEDHVLLIQLLKEHPGPVLISGYPNQIYDEQLNNWYRKFTIGFARGHKKRKEVLWLNPIAAEGLAQLRLFDA